MADTGLTSPTTTGTVSDDWGTPANAYADDTSYATSSTATNEQDYGGFGFSVLSSIDGIIVRCLMSANQFNRIDVDLSWDNGNTWTSAKSLGEDIAGSFTDYDFGGAEDDWGHAFTSGEMANGSFLVRVTNTTGSGNINLDHIEVQVYSSGTAYTLTAETGAYALTGKDVTLSRGYTMEAETGSYILTGIAVNFRQALHLIAETGSYALTGIDVSLSWATKMIALVGSYLLTGYDIIFRGGGSYEITNQSKSSAISPTNQSQNSISPTGQTKSSRSTFKNQEQS